MPTYVGLLRAVNLGGPNQVRMEALQGLLSRMGFADVRTFLRSGNVVFRSDERRAGLLETVLEDRVAKELGVRTDVLLRTAEEWREVLRGNPFPREAASAPNHLIVTALKETPPAARWAALSSAIRGPERVVGVGRHAFIVYPDGIARSRLTAATIEKNLGTRGTGRNWNTVTKLASIASTLG